MRIKYNFNPGQEFGRKVRGDRAAEGERELGLLRQPLLLQGAKSSPIPGHLNLFNVTLNRSGSTA